MALDFKSLFVVYTISIHIYGGKHLLEINFYINKNIELKAQKPSIPLQKGNIE